MIITLTGANNFLLNQELNKLTAAFVQEHGDLALERMDGEETTAERLIEAAQSLPFLAAKKLVVLRSPSAQKQFADNIEKAINDVPKTTDIIIVEPKLDKRSAYFKVLKVKTNFREYNEPDRTELNKWIVQYVNSRGGEIKLVDAIYLADKAGQNQQLLVNEMDKLLIYNPIIDRVSIDLLIEPTPQSTIFELLDAAFTGNVKRVDRLYKEQRALKVEPQQIIAMMAWQLHVLAIVKTASNKTPSQIAKEAKISPYTVQKTMGIANKITLAEVKGLILRTLELDIRLKSQNIDADAAIQELLMTIS